MLGSTLRRRLTLLVLAAMLPLLVFALVVAWLSYQAERTRQAEVTTSIARSIAISVELEVQRAKAGLLALGQSVRLCAGDLDAFRRQAETFVRTQHPGGNALLSTRDGQQLMNLLAEPGAILRRRKNLELVEATFAEASPVVSDVYRGTFQPKVVTIEVPVLCGGEVRYNLALSPPLDTYASVLRSQQVPEGWTVVLTDRRGSVIAQSAPEGGHVLQDRPTSAQGGMDASEGVVVLPVASGGAGTFSYSQAPNIGWTVMIRRPYQELRDEFQTRVLLLVIGGAWLVGLAIVSALVVSRSIHRPIACLGRLAAQGRSPGAPERSGIVEVDAVASRLEHAVGGLQQADRNKDEFISTLAHELRSPLGAIKNALSLLRAREPLSPPGQRATDIADRQLRQIERLVQDLLDMSRIRQAKVTLDLQPIDLREPLRDAADGKTAAFEEKSQRFNFEMPRDPIPVRGDVVRLTQVFSNLLDNACKYTQQGGSIRLEIAPENAGWCVSVSDDGQGIEPSRVSRVFDMFWQVPEGDGAGTRSGLGIGLALVKRLVEMHGGRVSVASSGLGTGSRFSVWLPNQGDPHAHADAKAPATHR